MMLALLRAGVAGWALAAMPLAAQELPDDYTTEVPPVGYYHNDGEDIPPATTRVMSPADLVRIAAPKGMTLQWIGATPRGEVRVLVDGDGVWRLIGSQIGPDDAYVGVDGVITEVGDNYFMLRGTIRIENTPDVGRRCEATADWRFAITQNRKYYRLRQFEWCDGLTDYVDIYF